MKIAFTIGLLCFVCVSCYPAESVAKEGRLRRRNGGNPDQVRARLPETIQTIPRNSEFVPIGRPEARQKQKKYTSNGALTPQRLTSSQGRRDHQAATAQTEAIEVKDIGAEASNTYSDTYDSGSYDDGRLTQSVQNSASSYNPDQGVQDGRLNFVISGQQGPHSYRFGYDTGKGADRTFRFEEKDAAGVIHGRYGYYDPTGKFRIVNYSAHPEHGFQAANNFGSK